MPNIEFRRFVNPLYIQSSLFNIRNPPVPRSGDKKTAYKLLCRQKVSAIAHDQLINLFDTLDLEKLAFEASDPLLVSAVGT